MYVRTEDLYHYGVKGMKWGVRRSKEELDRISGRAYDVEGHADGSYTIKKGSTFHRVSQNSNPKREGYAYVSFIDADVKGYRKEIAQWIDEKEGGDVKVYDLTMKATKDIHVPNEQTKVQTFIDLLANQKSYFTALKDKGFDAIEDSEDSFSHRINPLIVFERENTLKITKATELPEPSFDSKEWDKIVQDAKSAQKETNEYYKMVGIK